MTKNFCDMCGKELGEQDNVVSTRVKGQNLHLFFEIIVGQNGTWNKGEYCRDCVFDSIAQSDPRNQARADAREKE